MRRALSIGALSAWLLSGCVLGSGPCLWLQPFKHTLVGRVHFRDFAAADGVDNVPILLLDKTAYVYAPAQSHSCLLANDMQLTGIAEFPRDIGENTHVTVVGKLLEAAPRAQHTQFVIDVTSILAVAPGQ
jgi:hypothetical protein